MNEKIQILIDRGLFFEVKFMAANEYTQGRHQMAIEILACLKELKE